jgi:FkbM family methyltransferase
MKHISYAQNREDVVLHRTFAGQPTGFYVDIGANDPYHCSITRHFSGLGWRGINVEPGLSAFGRLMAARPRDINLNIGISNQEGTLCFYEAPATTTFSTFSSDFVGRLRQIGIVFEERRVPVLTLAQLCAKYVDNTIDFMSIDVEAHEYEVIQGGDWRRWRPRVVVVEDGFCAEGCRSHLKWETLLTDADYHFALFDGINRFYVREEDKHLLPVLSIPANVLDDFALHGYQDGVGPTSLLLARKLHAQALRHPRIAAAACWLGYRTVRELRRALKPLRWLKAPGRRCG